MATPSNPATAPSSALPPPNAPSNPPPKIDIKSLLLRLSPAPPAPPAVSSSTTANHTPVQPSEIADAIAHFFTDGVDDVQTGALLMCLHFTGLDRDPAVLSLCAQKMLGAAAQVDVAALRRVVKERGRREGAYEGGFVCHPLPSPCCPPILSIHAI